MKIFTKKEIAPIFVIIIMSIFALSLYMAPCITKIPTHWNAAGQIDGWSGKAFGALFVPILTIAMYLLMLFLPKTDPFKENYQYFEKQYYFIRLFLVLFMAGIFFFTFLTVMGKKLNIMYFMVSFLSLLFIFMGAVMPKIKRNYFVGIKTPWTLHSDEVWIKTHKLAGKTMITGGVLVFLTIFLKSETAFWAFWVVVLLSAFLPVVYSYLIYRRINPNGNTN
ncbi:MAG: SdpI family protein [Candidatus Staskawiczbacteria bacterium]|nr:SdpI family protein [Candidatus Staskawiczbacteria bacterium]